jgi:hypothetical protein
MIVVSSTERGHAGRVLPGGTAERLLHGSPCAVALAPHGYVRTPIAIVAAGFVDSPEGHAALADAHMLAARADATLRVITVLHPSNARDAPSAERDAASARARARGPPPHHRRCHAERGAQRPPAGVAVEPEIPRRRSRRRAAARVRARRAARLRLPRLQPRSAACCPAASRAGS